MGAMERNFNFGIVVGSGDSGAVGALATSASGTAGKIAEATLGTNSSKRKEAMVVGAHSPSTSSTTKEATAAIANSTPQSSIKHPTVLKSNQSFRVLTECPLTVMLLFQLYPQFLKTNIPILIPLMMDALKLCPPPPPPPPPPPSRQGQQQPPQPQKQQQQRVQGASPSSATGMQSGSSIPSVGITQATPKNLGSTGGVTNNEITAKFPADDSTLTSTEEKCSKSKEVSDEVQSSEEIRLRLYHTRAHELLAAQVKTLSFLTYLLRGFTDQMRPYEELMAQNVVSLMRNCPREAVSTRKELLVATRHILATDFRKGFFRHVDAMLDERILVGTLRSSAEQASLRPLGYSTLADLVHHARARLTPAQLSRVVRIFSRVLHDVSMNMPLSMQITAVRLLIHLVDQIFNNNDPNPQVGRDLLVRILNTFIQKFAIVKDRVPGLMEAAEKEIIQQRGEGGNTDIAHGDLMASPDVADDNDIFEYHSHSSPSLVLRDVQLLLRPMVQGMKTLIWCINSYSQQREKERRRATAAGEEPFPIPAYAKEQVNDEVNSAMLKMTQGERELVHQYIFDGLPCLRVFLLNVDADNESSSFPSSVKSKSQLSSPPSHRHREMLEAFASSFTILESFNFRRTMASTFPFILGEMEKDDDLIVIFKHLLLASGKSVSYEFCEILVTFLMKNISYLGEYTTVAYKSQQSSANGEDEEPSESLSPTATLSKHAQNLSKIFNTVFTSITKYERNEAALLPHLQTLISECLRRSTEGPMIWPGPFLSLLRSLFRTISGGKFEA